MSFFCSRRLQRFVSSFKSSDLNAIWFASPDARGELDSIFVDADMPLNQIYAYTIRAKDETGLISIMTPDKQIKLIGPNGSYKPIREIVTTINEEKKEITISWEMEDPQDCRSVLLYRGYDESRIGKYQYIDTPTMHFTEPLPEKGAVFYRLKPVFEGSQPSYMSEVIRYVSDAKE